MALHGDGAVPPVLREPSGSGGAWAPEG